MTASWTFRIEVGSTTAPRTPRNRLVRNNEIEPGIYLIDGSADGIELCNGVGVSWITQPWPAKTVQ